jgi:putative transcriptional regulator
MAGTAVTNTLRSHRFAKGEMTQQELADRVGLTRQTIIAIEQGRYAPSLEAAFRIARVFGVGVEDVFSYEGPHESGTPGTSFRIRTRVKTTT